MSQISDDNYFVVNGWMINKLNLSGTELMTFAIIYGFCQHDNMQGEFRGSLQYLADFTGSTKATIIKVPHHGSKTSSTQEFLEAVNSFSGKLKANGMTFNYHNHDFEFQKLDNGMTMIDYLILKLKEFKLFKWNYR